jgi:hypothetical protein
MSEVREGKPEGRDGDRDRTAKLPFEGDLKISAKPSLLHEWRNQGPHQNHEGAWCFYCIFVSVFNRGFFLTWNAVRRQLAAMPNAF